MTAKPTATADTDTLYEMAAKQVHQGRGGSQTIGSMTIPHLRATINALRHSHRKTFYEIVLAHKVQEQNAAIEARDRDEFEASDYHGEFWQWREEN